MEKHAESDRLQKALQKCLPLASPWKGELFRSASPMYANKDDVITGAGSKIIGGRWNPAGSFRTVYLSLDPETALAETLAHFRHFNLPESKAMPRVFIALEATLDRVLDLTAGATRRILGVSEKRVLDEPWRELQSEGREALTQALGRLAFEATLQAILVRSSARKTGANLVVFPENAPKAWVRIVNQEHLPPSFA